MAILWRSRGLGRAPGWSFGGMGAYINSIARRASYAFLCLAPFLFAPLVGARGLRISGVYQSIGLVFFTVFYIALWFLALRRFEVAREPQRRFTIAGLCLRTPFWLASLLWISIGTPGEATPPSCCSSRPRP